RDTASSINRNFIIEVMGRESGFLAVDVGIAGGAEIIIIPEIPITPEKLVKRLEHRRRAKLASIIVAAEAGEPGSSIKLAKAIKKLSGIEYKVCILGHTQRGGTPTAQDRVIGSLMGRHAVQALLDGASCQMVSLTANKIKMVDFAKPEQGTRFFSDTELVHMNEMICDI
nr:6-phosphofructokinase [Gammaproteobacteria bacterium]